jgi:hypothetical protein
MHPTFDRKVISCYTSKLENFQQKRRAKMPRTKKLFKDLAPGEAFSSGQTEIFENGIPGRPWLYLRIKQTNQAVFLPTGTIHDFRLDQEVKASEVIISEK